MGSGRERLGNAPSTAPADQHGVELPAHGAVRGEHLDGVGREPLPRRVARSVLAGVE